jgi:hypothetical protein
MNAQTADQKNTYRFPALPLLLASNAYDQIIGHVTWRLSAHWEPAHDQSI